MSDGLKLLAAALLAESPSALMRIDPSVFQDNETIAFDFIRTHLRQYRTLPASQTVREETGISLPTPREPLQFYIDAVEDRQVYNTVRQHYATLRDQIQSVDIDSMGESIRQMHNATRRSRRAPQVHTLGEGMQMVLDRMDRTRGLGGITGIESGIGPRFDTLTGGYQNSDIITWIGRPATGKTYNLLRQGQRAASEEYGHSVLFVTTEMGAEQIARRAVSLELGIDPTKMKLNMISTHTERRIRSMVRDMLTIDRFRIFAVGMNSKVTVIEALIEEFRPDIVFIDGVYLLHPSVKGPMKRIERVGEVFDELKGINIAADIPFVVSSQFNRQAGKDGKDGSLETIGFSDAIGTHSSIVVAIKNGPSANPRDSRTFEFMKGREGETGSISTHFQFAPLNFDEYTESEEAQNVSEGPDVGWMASGTGSTERRNRPDRRNNEE